jgi:SAM-dependent MidA family methyltransferase
MATIMTVQTRLRFAAETSTAAMPSPTSIPQLPAPVPDALIHCRKVRAHLQAEIAQSGGWMSFARFMELALYAPGLGYYAGGAAKFGAAGDFITAPEMTPLFGRTLAQTALPVLHQTGGDILELGAGSGRLALDLLRELETRQALPMQYRILEVSPDLQVRQHTLFETEAPHFLERLVWLDRLPASFSGLILANEVLDAMPVHLVHWLNGEVFERGVIDQAGEFAWQDTLLIDGPLWQAASAIEPGLDYLSEINLAAPASINSLAQCLERGVILCIDYGFPRSEYFHPQRDSGTLRVHYRHHSLDDPFYLPGLCDLTAHVDFSAVADAAVESGLDLLGYTSQANYLLNAGLLDLMTEMSPMSSDYLRAAAAVQKLLQPSEMGELFKAIAFGCGVTSDLHGFQRGDRRGAL